jgi:hypothetical protein
MSSHAGISPGIGLVSAHVAARYPPLSKRFRADNNIQAPIAERIDENGGMTFNMDDEVDEAEEPVLEPTGRSVLGSNYLPPASQHGSDNPIEEFTQVPEYLHLS